ncbi:hypothetical protein GCM10009737_30380 [Nocardioides lentus]|uniref:Restriction system protein Mrr-like N-terminal domain-containing protein n=1 Tax=Nocardioides lentus TaxID=338077 RepID=A0ABN2PPP4_9ACTN
MTQDWCELCELPLSQCPHGAPPPPPPVARTPPPRRPAPRPARAPSAQARDAAPATRAVTRRAPAARRTPPGRTPQADFRPVLLAVLAEQPVAVERDEVLAEVEQRMTFTDQDRGITADGETRWRRTALKERKAMVDDGLMDAAGHGMWLLSARGRDEAASRAEAAEAAGSDAGTDVDDE